MHATLHGITFSAFTAVALGLSATARAQAPAVPAPPAPDGAAAALPAPNAQNQNAQNGMQVLDQGPIHEAFAEAVVLDPGQGVVVNREPPEPINEVPPEVRADGDNVEWIPGYWMWSDEQNDFIWVSGVWRDVPPGRRWVPGHWTAVDGAFQWVSGFWAGAQAREVNMLPLPPETLEIGPSSPAPAANYFWVPGCWTWNNNAYGWRAGYWYAGQANWVWIPDRYCYTPQGVIFVNGYWDYPIARRGLLFAPVYWSRPVWGGPGWSYRPYSVVDTGLLLSALFINRHHHHYYFGHGQWRHRDHFRPWWDHSGRGRGYDPFCSYHRWHDGRNRDDWSNRYRQDFNRYQQNVNRPGGHPESLKLVSRVDVKRPQVGGVKVRTTSPGDLQRSREQMEQYRNLRVARTAAENQSQEQVGGKIAVEGGNRGPNGQVGDRGRGVIANGRDQTPGDRGPGDRGTRPVDAGKLDAGKLAGAGDREIIRNGGRTLENNGPAGSKRAAFKLPPVERTGGGQPIVGNQPAGDAATRPRFGTTGPESFERRPEGSSTPGIIRSGDGGNARPGGSSTPIQRDVIRGGGQSLNRAGGAEPFRGNDAIRSGSADAMRRQMGPGTPTFQNRGPTIDAQPRSRSSFPQSSQPRSLAPTGSGQLRGIQAPSGSRSSIAPRMAPSDGGPSSFRGAPSGGGRSIQAPAGGGNRAGAANRSRGRN